MAFKGFKLVAAMVTVSEIGTFSRFEHPKKLMAFLGLVPSENSSGKSRKQGGISKCGNPHARWLLVEQATHYRVPPEISPQLSERQRGAARWIRNSGKPRPASATVSPRCANARCTTTRSRSPSPANWSASCGNSAPASNRNWSEP